jgi:hypothetical protein
LNVFEHQALQSRMHGRPSFQEAFGYAFELVKACAIINGTTVYGEGKLALS